MLHITYVFELVTYMMTCYFSVATYVQLTVVTTYVYINFYFVSTYAYECMIDFVCVNSYLMCAATHVYIDSVLWQLLFMCENLYFYDNLYINVYTSSDLCANLGLTLLK